MENWTLFAAVFAVLALVAIIARVVHNRRQWAKFKAILDQEYREMEVRNEHACEVYKGVLAQCTKGGQKSFP